MDEADFRKQATDGGYGEPRPLLFSPNVSPQLHAHEFSVFLLVTRGELTLKFSEGEETFAVGDCCALPAGTLHDEYTGPGGADVLIATKT